MQESDLSDKIVLTRQLRQFVSELEADLNPAEQISREQILVGLSKQTEFQQVTAVPVNSTVARLLQPETAQACSSTNSLARQLTEDKELVCEEGKLACEEGKLQHLLEGALAAMPSEYQAAALAATLPEHQEAALVVSACPERPIVSQSAKYKGSNEPSCRISNSETKETSQRTRTPTVSAAGKHSKADEETKAPEWSREWSKQSKQFYWYNRKTGKSCWNNVSENASQTPSTVQGCDEQTPTRAPSMSAELNTDNATPASPDKNTWKRTWSKSRQRYYWFDQNTNQSKWEEPTLSTP